MSDAPVMPKFNFAVTVDDKAVAAANASRAGGDWLQAGKQKLEILKVEYKGTVPKDATWLRFSLTLGKPGTKPGDDGKYKGCIFHSVMVPTQDIVYQGKLGVFGMLSSFMAGLGVALTASNTPEVVQKYFTNFEGLTGMIIEVDLGYNGVHIAREKDLFYVLDKTKKRVPLSTENEFTSRDAALGQAIVDGFDVKKYLDVIRVHPGELQEPKTKEKPKSKKPVVTFDE